MIGNLDDMIEGVLIKPLKVFSDERGKVMRMLRVDDALFKQFGEIYFSLVNPNVMKGWKKHLKMTQNFAVPVGNIKLVLYDNRKDSQTYGKIQEIFVGTENYNLVQIPPQICYSFKAIGEGFALIANCSDLPHDSKEAVKLDPIINHIPYIWE